MGDTQRHLGLVRPPVERDHGGHPNDMSGRSEVTSSSGYRR